MKTDFSSIDTVAWRDGAVVMLDQRRLPFEETYIECRDVDSVVEAIRTMAVRGAPAIGIAAGYGMALAARLSGGATDELARAARLLVDARPTAVNLLWAVDRVRRAGEASGLGGDALVARIAREADAILAEDVAACRALGDHGAALVPDDATILTHCNAGGLATSGWGTALGVVRSAIAMGKRVRVIADETRPLLQGARLTAWELMRDGIDVTLIADVAAASILASGAIDLVVVGADRIAANGDTANKIGTYGVALAAHADGVPFYVAAPWSTVDMACPDGDAIEIEERAASEVTHVLGTRVAPEGVSVRNPAFDVTPFELVTAIITERGVVRPQYDDGLKALAK
ncbi:MAG: S-methyl-5-thioribose-1-phosphate isomerase [Proteobacteria bacterium]|jgi:methylthioribose-1-phosphate isomerase|nr:S-methyl-5-thioribose-1-phosphate isomerase [Pseudomonadota bacterium]